jgi:hypothetical protein
MLRFVYALQVLAAGALFAPLWSGQSSEAALQRTRAALEQLEGLQRRHALNPQETAESILRWTEPAGVQDPERLSLLREQVQELQNELDARNASAIQATEVEPEEDRIATVGMDDALRAQLARPAEQLRPAQTPSTSSRHQTGSANPSGELPGYSADRVLEARALYRAGRVEEGLALLKSLAGDPAAAYWKARCLERLERFEEALEAYRAVLALTDVGYEADRARADIQFLEWKLGFLRQIEAARRL